RRRLADLDCTVERQGLQRRPKRDPFSAGWVIRSRERAAPMSRRDCDPRAWFRLDRNDGYDPFVWVVRLDRLDALDRREPAVPSRRQGAEATAYGRGAPGARREGRAVALPGGGLRRGSWSRFSADRGS